MKTLLFFDRCDLTRLYVQLTTELQGKFNVIHVAYSQADIELLKGAGIRDYFDYQSEFSHLVDTLNVTEDLLRELDDFIIKYSKGKFTLNGSIQSDRGFTILKYEEALLLACCHYTIWKRIFSEHHVDVVYHEPASQFMTHIASLCCKAQGGQFIYQTQLQGDKKGYQYLNIDGENYSCPELEQNYSYYLEHPNEINKERCEEYVKSFRENYEVSFSNLIKSDVTKWHLFLSSIKHRLHQIKNHNAYNRLKNNIDYWILHNNCAAEKLYNLRQYKKRGIVFSRPVEGEKYFYYSVHLEPEATVLYLGDGIYANQVKLIENIAAALPAGYYLYVKDHPHEYAYRKADDYERLLSIPNIRLIDQHIPGKRLLKDAQGVFSINGTVGFEGLVLGKRVFCFGESYYSIYPRVNYIKSIREAREIIYNSMRTTIDFDDVFYAFIYSYLISLHCGFVTYFGNRPEIAGIDQNSNARTIAAEIINYIEK